LRTTTTSVAPVRQVVLTATAQVCGLAVLTAIAAQVQAPLVPVPVTLQTAAVLLAGLWAGSRLGAAAQATYLAAGFAGLPVFAGLLGGPAVLLGPTAGYLAAFPAAAWIAGLGSGRGLLARFAAAGTGALLVLACGGAWLAVVGGAGTALAAGIFPFLGPEMVKAALVAAGVAFLPGRRG